MGRGLMKLAFVFWLLIVGVLTASARPAEIILLRHAEKPPDDEGIHLSAQGEERARALAALLTTSPALLSNGLPAALFAPRSTSGRPSRRAQETLGPLAQRLDLRVETPHSAKNYAALAEELLHNRALDGKTVVVCWVHEFLPHLAEALGVTPRRRPWRGSVFDRLWVITYAGKKASLADLPQALLPGDSAR